MLPGEVIEPDEARVGPLVSAKPDNPAVMLCDVGHVDATHAEGPCTPTNVPGSLCTPVPEAELTMVEPKEETVTAQGRWGSLSLVAQKRDRFMPIAVSDCEGPQCHSPAEMSLPASSDDERDSSSAGMMHLPADPYAVLQEVVHLQDGPANLCPSEDHWIPPEGDVCQLSKFDHNCAHNYSSPHNYDHYCCAHNHNYSCAHNHNYSCAHNHNYSCAHNYDHYSCAHNHNYSCAHNHNYSCAHNYDYYSCAHNHNYSCAHNYDNYSCAHNHNYSCAHNYDNYSCAHNHNYSCAHNHNYSCAHNYDNYSCAHNHNYSCAHNYDHYSCAHNHNYSCAHNYDHYSSPHNYDHYSCAHNHNYSCAHNHNYSCAHNYDYYSCAHNHNYSCAHNYSNAHNYDHNYSSTQNYSRKGTHWSPRIWNRPSCHCSSDFMLADVHNLLFFLP
ncbi:uncharacterized protein LOC142471448 [Ascaphus truei]|uniref:uncharacterized protein LOC142471448 n=1 Tax=Ascaphus truei TaxID=8439 RepID=UPI003F5A2A4F